MRLGSLAETLRAVEAEPARLKATALMTSLFEKALREAPDELLPCIALATMQLLPASRPLKLGMGERGWTKGRSPSFEHLGSMY